MVEAVRKDGRKAVALQLDVSESTGFNDFAQRLKAALASTWQRDRFDHLVNNAGTGLHASFEETPKPSSTSCSPFT